MLFTQPIFFLFFLAVFGLHWCLRRNTDRKLLLLVGSYVFYGAWDWRFLFLILASTVIDFVVGLVLRSASPRGGRKLWLVVSLLANLGILGFFKYFNFFVGSGVGVLHMLGIEVPELTLDIILPVGISFFTFQSMSYTIDVYRGNLAPIRNFLDFALYVSFFPQLVAGPIVRAKEFLPQLSVPRRFRDVRFKAPIALFLCGFFKKACIADNLAPTIDAVFASPEAYTGFSMWIAVLFYAVQIYCDFSGYTDMAIAVARLLGYELCVNFEFPYFARSIQEFWRRWHMSLSSWLRDYLYIGLGGNRGSPLFAFRNVLLTMLLGGLWHGASWNFVVWGGLHGCALGVHRLYTSSPLRGLRASRLWRQLALVATFYWVCVAWVFFRATDFGTAMTVLKGFVLFRGGDELALSSSLALWLLPLALLHWINYRKPIPERMERVPDAVAAFGFGVATACMLLFIPVAYRPFIYFQF
ncbi:MAG: MBOAT family O-acyltransferase [Planctomycetota bacterium]|jgi:alginate O-acetyltransferase complex protein AlgI